MEVITCSIRQVRNLGNYETLTVELTASTSNDELKAGGAQALHDKVVSLLAELAQRPKHPSSAVEQGSEDKPF